MTVLSLRRRLFHASALLCLAVAAGSAGAFGFDDVATRAHDLAAAPYKPAAIRMPPELRDLDYDAYRDIRFRPEKALWHGDNLPFELMFFHQGRTVPEPIRVNVIEPSGTVAVPFDPASFDYGRNKFDRSKLADLGFNGFRVHYALNTPNYKDEVLVFQGASYFRALGKGQGYGLSARGLAVDTASATGRGVSALRRVLGRAAQAESDGARHLRAARFGSGWRGPTASCSLRVSRRRCRSRRGCSSGTVSPSSGWLR